MTAVTRKIRLESMETWSRELDLEAVADRHGTPLYITHRPTLENAFARWADLVGDPGRVRYPVKANPSPPLLALLASLGSGADCASPDEIRAAQLAGIPIDRVSYTTPAFDAGLAEQLVRAGGTAVVDSPQGLRDLSDHLGGTPFPGRVFLRVNPGGLPGYRVTSDVQRYTDHGSESSQFGIPSEKIPDLLRDETLPITGLHVHVGTQMDNLDTFAAGVGYLHHLVDLLHRETSHRLSTVNLGGGLGIPFLPEQEFPSLEAYQETLEPLLRSDLTYHVEPGNALVGRAMGLLTRVVAKKESRGRRWGIVDVGTDQLVKHTIARWEHNLVDAQGRSLDREGPDSLAGPLCFAGDVLLPETRLDDVDPGDVLLVQHAGAYCESVSSRFNGRRAPAHVWIEHDGSIRSMRASEDPFFDPRYQTWHPVVPGQGEPVPERRMAALESTYMRDAATHETYRMERVENCGKGVYRFAFETEAEVDFVAMPFALRMVGDASIVAVGLELGWDQKPGPVWATRLSMSCGNTLPSGSDPIPCVIEVSPMARSFRGDGARTALVRYRLGEDDEVTGSARVVVPGTAS